MAEKRYTIRLFKKTVYEANLLDASGAYVGSSLQNCHSAEEALQGAHEALSQRERKLSAGDTVVVTVDEYNP